MIGRRVRRRLKNLALAAAVFWATALVALPASASAWARKSGELFISSKAEYFVARADRPTAPFLQPARFERYDNDTYTEFGLTKTITVGGKAIYGSSNFFDGAAARTASGFSEIEGFVQFEAMRNRLGVFSIKLAGAAPSRFETGERPGLVNDGADVEARVLYGRNILRHPFKLFANVEAGYRKRFGSAADQIRADLLIGAAPSKRILLLAEILSSTSLRNESLGGADYDVMKIQPSAIWRVSKRYSLRAGMTHEMAGRNLLLGDAYFIGLWSVF